MHDLFLETDFQKVSTITNPRPSSSNDLGLGIRIVGVLVGMPFLVRQATL